MVPRYIHVFSRSRVACFLWCRRQNGDRRTTVYQVTGREEESYRLFGRTRYDAITDSLLRFPTPFVDPLEGSNVPRQGRGPLQHRESSPNLSWYQQTCPLFCFLPVPSFPVYFLKMALTPAWIADTSSVGVTVTLPGGGDTLDILPPPNTQVAFIPNYFSLTTKINKMVQLKQY